MISFDFGKTTAKTPFLQCNHAIIKNQNKIHKMLIGGLFMPKKIEIEYPETLPDLFQEDEASFKHELKMAMAVKLFELNRISSGIAAKLVGIDRVSFLKELVKYQVSIHHYDVNELDTDVENA